MDVFLARVLFFSILPSFLRSPGVGGSWSWRPGVDGQGKERGPEERK